MSDYRNAADYREKIKNEDDVEICITVFRYAVDCVLSEIRRIKKRIPAMTVDMLLSCVTDMAWDLQWEYCRPFGSRKRKMKSTGRCWWSTKKSWGCKDMKKENFRAKARENISIREYERGFVHGKAFDPHERMVKRKDL